MLIQGATDNEHSKSTDYSRALYRRLPYRKISLILLIISFFSTLALYVGYGTEELLHGLLCSWHATKEPETFLGSQLCLVDAPQNSILDVGFDFSLHDEADQFTAVSPYLKIVESGSKEVESYGISISLTSLSGDA